MTDRPALWPASLSTQARTLAADLPLAHTQTLLDTQAVLLAMAEALDAAYTALRATPDTDGLRVGQQVRKITGDYQWGGVVCAVFHTPAGRRRYVVAHPVDTGWVLHIYSDTNLEPVTE